MTFLTIAVVTWMLSAAGTEYLDNSSPRIVYETEVTFNIKNLKVRDTSPNKDQVPDVITIGIVCRDLEEESKLSIDYSEVHSTNSWLLADRYLDDITVGIIDTLALEASLEVCNAIAKTERAYQKYLKKERRT